MTLAASLVFIVEAKANTAPSKPADTIPWSQLGAQAGADYKGDGLSVTPTDNGARLRCAFQRLEGEATTEGLWLTSTITNSASDRFRVIATAVGRSLELRQVVECDTVPSLSRSPATRDENLSFTGSVTISNQTAQFIRPGLIEEYSVSMDGIRQDFLVLQKPTLNSKPSTLNYPAGALRVDLSVIGAHVEATPHGVQLMLGNSGRKIAYSRLHVTDATGRELPARMEAAAQSAVCHLPSAIVPVQVQHIGNADGSRHR